MSPAINACSNAPNEPSRRHSLPVVRGFIDSPFCFSDVLLEPRGIFLEWGAEATLQDIPERERCYIHDRNAWDRPPAGKPKQRETTEQKWNEAKRPEYGKRHFTAHGGRGFSLAVTPIVNDAQNKDDPTQCCQNGLYHFFAA